LRKIEVFRKDWYSWKQKKKKPGKIRFPESNAMPTKV